MANLPTWLITGVAGSVPRGSPVAVGSESDVGGGSAGATLDSRQRFGNTSFIETLTKGRTLVPKALALLITILSVACASLSTPGKAFGQPGCGAPIIDQVFEQNASGSDWSKVNNLVAFDKMADDGLYHIYTVKPDGSDLQRLGLGSSTFPQRTTGTPVWSPSGKYFVFAAEKGKHPGNSAGAAPGWGGYSDLWVATADGSHAWQLTDVPADNDHGTIEPEFSPDGQLLEWTERTQAGRVLNPVQVSGFWVVKVARFTVGADGTPSISDVRTISPAGDAFNETGGFSPDSSSLTFASDFETRDFWTSQIYRFDLRSGAITRLTQGNHYNEHPRFTPDGRILWMTNTDEPFASIGTDWWLMNADGSAPTRLSTFNDPKSPEYFGKRNVYATVVQTDSWSPDETYFFGDLETSLLTSSSNSSAILRVSLACH